MASYMLRNYKVEIFVLFVSFKDSILQYLDRENGEKTIKVVHKSGSFSLFHETLILNK